MPNLKQIYELRQEYGELNTTDAKVKDYLEKTQAKNTLIKAFNSEILNESREDRLFSFIKENINIKKPDLIKYFEEGKEEDVALLFIDITSFSQTISGWSNIQIKDYLDDYYEQIIPVIYKHGGEIEKLMGDGIIVVFGKPFLNLGNPDYVYKAESCAREAIKLFYDSDKNVKVAIHKGKITYYKVPGEYYGEYTMIGQPVTDLYRLESISKPNAINFYTDSLYDKLGWTSSLFNLKEIVALEYLTGSLQGVGFSKFKTIKFPGYY